MTERPIFLGPDRREPMRKSCGETMHRIFDLAQRLHTKLDAEVIDRLSRLEAKGFVGHDDARPRRFRPRASRTEHAAELMHEVLGQAGDRQAVLARFVGGVDPEEARMLRQLLAED